VNHGPFGQKIIRSRTLAGRTAGGEPHRGPGLLVDIDLKFGTLGTNALDQANM